MGGNCLGGTYLAAFIVLRRARSAPGGVGADNCGLFPTGLWLAVTAVVAATSYALHYAEAAQPPQALTLFAGAVVGRGVALLETRRVKGQRGNSVAATASALIVLLAVAAVCQVENEHVFQYRGQVRWSGPWDNPNMFGILMGAGAVLAVGMLVSEKQRTESKKQKWEASIWHPMSNIAHPIGGYGSSGDCMWWRRGRWGGFGEEL